MKHPITWAFRWDSPIGAAEITDQSIILTIDRKTVEPILTAEPVILGATVKKTYGMPDEIVGFSLSPVPSYPKRD